MREGLHSQELEDGDSEMHKGGRSYCKEMGTAAVSACHFFSSSHAQSDGPVQRGGSLLKGEKDKMGCSVAFVNGVAHRRPPPLTKKQKKNLTPTCAAATRFLVSDSYVTCRRRERVRGKVWAALHSVLVTGENRSRCSVSAFRGQAGR